MCSDGSSNTDSAMRKIDFIRLVVALSLAIASRAADAPVREHLQAKEWTIGFVPGDRAVAEQLAVEIDDFDRRLTEAVGIKHELGSEELEKRADEIAKKTAELLQLPGKSEEFRQEIVRVAQAVSGVTAALRGMFLQHKIEIWRTAEVRERLAAGEKIEGFTWDPVERRPNANLKFNWEISPVDYHVTKN